MKPIRNVLLLAAALALAACGFHLRKGVNLPAADTADPSIPLKTILTAHDDTGK